MDIAEDRVVRFHLDADVLPADVLKGCVVDFIDLLKEAAVDCLSDIQWFASVEKGSVALALYPTSTTETEEEIDDCLAALNKNFTLIRNDKPPSDFSAKTMKRYSQFMRHFTHGGEVVGCPTIQVESPRLQKNAPVVLRLVESVSNDNKPIPSWGAVSGLVKSISAVKELYLVLYEEGCGNRVKVTYSPDMVDSVRQSFENRVTVVGDVYYSDEGVKKQIIADRINLDSEPEDQVLFSDLFGILAEGAR